MMSAQLHEQKEYSSTLQHSTIQGQSNLGFINLRLEAVFFLK